MGEQFQHDLKGSERFGSPVDGNEGKEAMLDLVPLAGRRRIMSHGDRELFLIRQFLKLFLPEAISGPIGTTPISRDQQFLFAWIKRFATAVPPPSDALHSKLRSIMIDTHVDEALVVDQIIDAIGHGFAISQRKKIIHIHARLL